MRKTYRIITSVLSIILLAGCSFTQDTNTHSADDVTLSDSVDIYKNADEVISREYECISFADDIKVGGSTEIYNLTLRGDNPEGSSELVIQHGRELARLFVGEKYNEKNESISDDGKYCIYSYDDGEFSCNFDSVDSYQVNDRYVTIPTEITDYTKYDLKSCDMSQTIDIGNEQTALSEVYDTNHSLWNDKLSSFLGGLEIEPRLVLSYEHGEKGACKVINTYAYKGVPIDYISSPFVVIDRKTEGNYNKTDCDSIMYKKGEVFYASSLLRYTLDKAEKIDELISFEEAVNILDRELKGDFKFTGCELIYTNIAVLDSSEKIWDHDYDYKEKWEFTPTWCFYLNTNNAAIDSADYSPSVRVDAISGEIRVVVEQADR